MYKRQHPITMLLELKITDFIPLIIFMFGLNGKFPFWYLIPAAFGLLTVFQHLKNGITQHIGLKITYYM